MPVYTINTGNTRYGPLQENFQFSVPDSYGALVGPNNSGKSAILQLAFRTAYDGGGGQAGPGATCLILPDRTQLAPTAETGGRTLEIYNQELVDQLRSGAPLSYDSAAGPARNELTRLLLNHTDFEAQLAELQTLLARLGFSRLRLQVNQRVTFEDVAGHYQGSGLRALLPILCALTDEAQKVTLIDEPEEALEPRLQKALRDLLIEKAAERSILVSTHSHLFLNRRDAAANLRVRRLETHVVVEAVSSIEELYDLSFNLLGNSTEDLFFPANYLLVEGASDQIILERVLLLLDVPHGRIKIVAAGGVDAMPDTLAALHRALLPVVMRGSPYADRVVAMIDAPTDPESHTVAELRRVLKERLVELSEPSIEAAIPVEVYERAGVSKDEVLRRLEDLKGDFRAEFAEKKSISREIAAAIEGADLEGIPKVVAAARLALEHMADTESAHRD